MVKQQASHTAVTSPSNNTPQLNYYVQSDEGVGVVNPSRSSRELSMVRPTSCVHSRPCKHCRSAHSSASGSRHQSSALAVAIKPEWSSAWGALISGGIRSKQSFVGWSLTSFGDSEGSEWGGHPSCQEARGPALYHAETRRMGCSFERDPEPCFPSLLSAGAMSSGAVLCARASSPRRRTT